MLLTYRKRLKTALLSYILTQISLLIFHQDFSFQRRHVPSGGSLRRLNKGTHQISISCVLTTKITLHPLLLHTSASIAQCQHCSNEAECCVTRQTRTYIYRNLPHGLKIKQNICCAKQKCSTLYKPVLVHGFSPEQRVVICSCFYNYSNNTHFAEYLEFVYSWCIISILSQSLQPKQICKLVYFWVKILFL